MAHYSILMTSSDGALVLGATRDYHEPVPASALILAPGDEVLWVSEGGDRTVTFEESPFASGMRTIEARHLIPTTAEVVAGTGRAPRDVFRYFVHDRGDRRPVGAGHLIVDSPAETQGVSPSARPARLENISLDRDGRCADRTGRKTVMAAHLLKVKVDSTHKTLDVDYFNGPNAGAKENAYPSLVVKPGDDVHWELQGTDGVLVAYFAQCKPPFHKGATFHGKAKTAFGGQVVGKDEVNDVLNKYTLVYANASGANSTEMIVADPYIIIDNTE